MERNLNEENVTKKVESRTIDGIFGKFDIPKDIEFDFDDFTKDDYFKLALLEVLRSIDKKLGNDNYVKVKEPMTININGVNPSDVKSFVSSLRTLANNRA